GFLAGNRATNQLPPAGDWQVWLLLAGRGFGKTRTLAEWVCQQAASGQAGRIAVVAATAPHARGVLVEGESGNLAVAPPWFRPLYGHLRVLSGECASIQRTQSRKPAAVAKVPAKR